MIFEVIEGGLETEVYLNSKCVHECVFEFFVVH